MDNENVPESETEANPVAEKGSLFATLWTFIKNTEKVVGGPRHVADAGLLTICIVFLAAILGVPQKQIDIPLTTALVAFAFALPALACGFLLTYYKVISIPGAFSLEGVLKAGLTVAWIVEGLGELAATAGMLAIIAHLSSLVFTAFVSEVIVFIVGLFFLLLLFCFTFTGIASLKQAYVQKRTAGNTRSNNGK